MSIYIFILTLFFVTACSSSDTNNISSGDNSSNTDSKATRVIMQNNTRYALFADGSLFAWGDNTYGLLGSGSDAVNSEKPVYIAENIKEIFASDNVTYAVSNDNTLYAWGYNEYGQTGTGNNAANINTPSKVNGITGNIKTIYTIDNSVFALTDDGSLFAWGDNTNGLLGLGLAESKVTTPQKITSINGFIKEIAVNKSKFSVFAITDDNSLYAWGDNQYGQIGIGNNNGIINTPAKIDGITGNMKQIYTGEYSSYALTYDNSIYAWGNNQNGQLGLGLDNITVNTPAKINGITGNIKEIINNSNSVYVLTDDNSLYLWGDNQNGELGLGAERPIVNTPVKIDNLGAVKNIYPAMFATFIVTTDNSLYASGANNYGQLGLGNLEKRYAFEKVSGYTGNINKIYSNLSCTYMLTDDNSLYDWGSNSYGELGLGDDINRFKPEKVNGISGVIKDIFVNGEQAYLLMEDDSIYSWGLNDFMIDITAYNGLLGRTGSSYEPQKILFNK